MKTKRDSSKLLLIVKCLGNERIENINAAVSEKAYWMYSKNSVQLPHEYLDPGDELAIRYYLTDQSSRKEEVLISRMSQGEKQKLKKLIIF